MSNKIEIYDTTLRDGAQGAGISFSCADKLRIAERLDLFGVQYIELGWPGSNPKDIEVFSAVKNMHFKNSQIVAFGRTCAKGVMPEDDKMLVTLLAAETNVIAIVGKSSRYQVEKVLGASLAENLRLIRQTCKFLRGCGREVFFDAEHFFDGYKKDSSYAIDCLRAAVEGGASRLVLCDTNGGSLPWEIFDSVKNVMCKSLAPAKIAIHAHNDGGMAEANTLIAVRAGASQVQVTVNGYGERCGNTNLCTVIPALLDKMQLQCIPEESLSQLTKLARFTAEITNLPLDQNSPYVGGNAFRDKAGMHASATQKEPGSYRHIKPERVGNCSSVAVSELAGRKNIGMKAKEFGITLTDNQIGLVLTEVEKLENNGFQFEDADGSLWLMMMRFSESYSRPFEVIKRRVLSEKRGCGDSISEATVKIRIKNGKDETTFHVSEGDGSVNALDNALRKALLPHFQCLLHTELVGYKVRALDGIHGTAKAVRILIDFSNNYTTVGCSTDLIEASFQALLDGYEFAILKSMAR